MISLDTNLLVRLILGDDKPQTIAARRAIQAERAAVQMTVILETAWVLRRRYGQSALQVAAILERLADTEGVETPTRLPEVAAAARAGIEVDDAIHLAECAAPKFATFDKKLVRRAARGFKSPVVFSP